MEGKGYYCDAAFVSVKERGGGGVGLQKVIKGMFSSHSQS